jgi:fructose-1-phosphate kinase PfkB-like protein
VTWDGFVDTVRAELTDGSVGPVDGMAQLVAMARATGVSIAIDCSGEPLRRALVERPTIVKLNLAEAAATLVGHESGERTAVGMARELTARTGGTTIITLGLDGAIAVAPDGQALRVAPPTVRGRYPVGSGDAFMAGVATAILSGAPLDDALRLGAAAAAANAQRQGAGRLEEAEVAQTLSTISVVPIAR